ncbi:hypothetical protein [Gordonia sp. NPDC003950]
MRLVMGIALHDDHLVVAAGTAADIAGANPRPPHLTTRPAQLWWPAGATPRLPRTTDHPGDLFGHYLDRLTEVTPIRTAARQNRPAHQLVVATVALAIEQAERAGGGHVGAVTIAHPASWSPEQIGTLRRAVGISRLSRTRSITVVSERLAISRCIRWSGHMGITGSVADHPVFVSAWGAAMLAATTVCRLPAPRPSAARTLPRAPHRTGRPTTHPIPRTLASATSSRTAVSATAPRPHVGTRDRWKSQCQH